MRRHFATNFKEEFVKVTIPKVMKALVEKDVKVLDLKTVQDYQNSVIVDDLKSRRAEFWKKHGARKFFAIISTSSDFVKIERRNWETSSMKVFRNEYISFLPHNLCACYLKNGMSRCAPMIKFEVQYHPASQVRFLIASNPDEPEEQKYYVDYWEKP